MNQNSINVSNAINQLIFNVTNTLEDLYELRDIAEKQNVTQDDSIGNDENVLIQKGIEFLSLLGISAEPCYSDFNINEVLEFTSNVRFNTILETDEFFLNTLDEWFTESNFDTEFYNNRQYTHIFEFPNYGLIIYEYDYISNKPYIRLVNGFY